MISLCPISPVGACGAVLRDGNIDNRRRKRNLSFRKKPPLSVGKERQTYRERGAEKFDKKDMRGVSQWKESTYKVYSTDSVGRGSDADHLRPFAIQHVHDGLEHAAVRVGGPDNDDFIHDFTPNGKGRRPPARPPPFAVLTILVSRQLSASRNFHH